MTLRERFTRWLEYTRSVMKPMPLRKKIGYIIYYYKGWFFGLLVLALFIGYIGDAVAQSHREIYLQGFFTNDEWNLFEAEDIERDYSAQVNLTKKQHIIFDDALYIDTGGEATEYTAASNGKLIAYMAVQELDFCVTSESVLHHYEESTPMLDLREMLPQDMLEKLEPYLYEYKGKAVALDMTACRFVAGVGADSDYRSGETFFLFVPQLAPHPERTCDFIRWCFPGLF